MTSVVDLDPYSGASWMQISVKMEAKDVRFM